MLVSRIILRLSRSSTKLAPYVPQKSVRFSSHDRTQSAGSKLKASVRRVLPNHTDRPEDVCWSVVAYNICDTLVINETSKILEKFTEYQLNPLPKDLEAEAIMLSFKYNQLDVDLHMKEQPLNDIFIFRTGSIVFWGVPEGEQKRFLYGLSNFMVDPIAKDLIKEEREQLRYQLVDRGDRSKLNREQIELLVSSDKSRQFLDQFALSHAIASSVQLGVCELTLDQYILSLDPITMMMKNGEKLTLSRDQLFRKTGEIYELKHRIILSSDLLDLPDVYWDRYQQEILYLSLVSFLNIKRRTAVMNEKLNNCSELLNLLTSHMNDKHHVRLELMIIILIMVEVLFEVTRLF